VFCNVIAVWQLSVTFFSFFIAIVKGQRITAEAWLHNYTHLLRGDKCGAMQPFVEIVWPFIVVVNYICKMFLSR